MSAPTITVPVLSTEAKQVIQTVLRRAAEDIEFRTLLLEDPMAALADTELTECEKLAFATMKRVGLEEWGIDVRRFRAFLRDNGNSIGPAREGVGM